MKWSWPRWSRATPVPSKQRATYGGRLGSRARVEGEGVESWGEVLTLDAAWMASHSQRVRWYSWVGARPRADLL
jgi:hypothetical protein